MKRDKEAGARIKALRGNATQAEFAKSFGVTQSMISAWEAGRDLPSAENWILLGELAGYPDCYWFYEQAGLDRQKLLAATERTLKEQIKEADSPLLEGRIVLVPRVRSLQGLEPAGRPVPMPPEAVPNLLSTYCLPFGENEVVLDTTGAKSGDLTPFWGQLVLAEFSSEHDMPWPKGVQIIGLLLGPQKHIVLGRVDWQAEFCPMGYLGQFGSYIVGIWTEGFLPKIETAQSSDRSQTRTDEDYRRAAERVRREFQRRAKENHPKLASESEAEWESRAYEAEHKAGEERLKRISRETVANEMKRVGRAAKAVHIPEGCKMLGRVISWFPGKAEMQGGQK